MQVGSRIAAVIFAGLTILPNSPGQTPANRALATFPAQQRPPGDPALIARGKNIYTVSCQSCHGLDLRGGDLGGPNLLRSQVVLSDLNGELILPIVQGARQSTGMPAISLSPDDVTATATYIHIVVATSRGQGAPPDVGIAPTTILVGDASAGKRYFDEKCASCHSVTGDLQGIATRYSDPKLLQNRWVSGGAGGRGGNSDRRTVTVTVTKPSGEKLDGRLIRIDDFFVTLANPDGSMTTIRRDGDKPKVEVKDPMQAHRDLLSIYSDKNMHDVTAFLVTLK
jgi:cytochrome c oxidase cbb3-type subunit 3